MLYAWIQQLTVYGDHAFPGSRRLKPGDQEIRNLRLELKWVTEERDILRKVTSLLFAP